MSIYDTFSDAERAILQARSERAARQLISSKDDDHSTLTALIVHIGRETYALPIDMVLTVYQEMLIVPVPCTPSFLAGITNIRGHISSVVSLGTLLGAPEPLPLDNAALVMVANQDTSLAFQVDDIGAVQPFSLNEIIPLPTNLDVVHSNYVQGMLPDGATLLDVNAILTDPTLIVNDAFDDLNLRGGN